MGSALQHLQQLTTPAWCWHCKVQILNSADAPKVEFYVQYSTYFSGMNIGVSNMVYKQVESERGSSAPDYVANASSIRH